MRQMRYCCCVGACVIIWAYMFGDFLLGLVHVETRVVVNGGAFSHICCNSVKREPQRFGLDALHDILLCYFGFKNLAPLIDIGC